MGSNFDKCKTFKTLQVKFFFAKTFFKMISVTTLIKI